MGADKSMLYARATHQARTRVLIDAAGDAVDLMGLAWAPRETIRERHREY
jgi:hypothetical protein